MGALYAVMRRVLKRGDEIPMVKPTDYSEMLPLVPDLIKHACEVNVKVLRSRSFKSYLLTSHLILQNFYSSEQNTYSEVVADLVDRLNAMQLQ